MADHSQEQDFFEELFSNTFPTANEAVRAPARLKSRTYSKLALRQAESGPLRSVTETKASRRGLCAFEELARAMPFGERFKSRNFCRACHARKLAEELEKAPIYWGNCPYVKFQE